ncbi:TetR/AcrR family transcriptional regulator [Ancylobacter sp. IITR112]|uniref:TetR/AcrR family transcriptional regulator n=1 Tax=Ancylobacter sp. IITR112 TaxID=3138073 RepID=UPI00352AE915
MQNSDETCRKGAAPPSRHRGRPRAFDREAALAQAMRLFWTRGYEATSIADLTAAMGIGAPSLYAAFGSKEALYVEALEHYTRSYECLAWAGFRAAATAREAIAALLFDSAASLTGCVADIPHGCMVTLASVDCEEHRALGDHLRLSRAGGLEQLTARLARGVAEGDLPAGLDCQALARFLQAVQAGMSLLARDGVGRAELEAVAELALQGVDARLAAAASGGRAPFSPRP